MKNELEKKGDMSLKLMYTKKAPVLLAFKDL